MLLSLVVPCYNEEGNVTRFWNETSRVFSGKVEKFEVIFVDDGSRDKTYEEILALHNSHQEVRGISFSRNFGKEAAMLAGLRASRGDLVCLIDADLQQRPEVVLEMLSYMKEDEELDCVAAYQDKRNEGKFISFLKSSFYKIINKISDVSFVNGASDFRLMKRDMVDAIISLTEKNRFTKGIFGYVGFNTKFIPFTHAKREIGTTKWGLIKLFKYAFHGILAFSIAPLKIPMIMGAISIVGAVAVALAELITKGFTPWSESAIIALVVLAIGGAQMLSLGIVAEYLSKMYIEVKDRPTYFIRRRLDHEMSLTETAESYIAESAKSEATDD
jgi:glycosyltransferase involved in cell wall biosynthesis